MAAFTFRDMSSVFLAGYDGSASSRAAVELAMRLSRGLGARVVATDVYPHATAAYWIPVESPLHDELEDEYRREAEGVLADLEAEDIERLAVAADSPARGLHDLAIETGAELIAVGATHRGALGRLAPGSVGMHLLHGAPCPVVVAPSDVEEAPLRTIGVAYDDRAESRAALPWARRLARALDAQLLLVGALEPLAAAVPLGHPGIPIRIEEPAQAATRRFEAMLRDTAEREGCGYRKALGPAAHTIAEVSADVDLLVTGSRGYGAIRGVVLGSVSRHLVDHARCPVLVVPRPG